MLIFPEIHYESLQETPILHTKGILARKAGQILLDLGYNGYVVLEREGQRSGKSVPHVHTHIIPTTSENDVAFGFQDITETLDIATMAQECRDIAGWGPYTYY